MIHLQSKLPVFEDSLCAASEDGRAAVFYRVVPLSRTAVHGHACVPCGLWISGWANPVAFERRIAPGEVCNVETDHPGDLGLRFRVIDDGRARVVDVEIIPNSEARP